MAIRTVNSCCGNQGGLVEHFIGTAYDVVKTVYDNLGILQYIYDFLNQHGVLVTVDSVDELKALNTDMKYARVYTFSNTAGYGYTDYLYVEGNNSGVVPNDPDATGTWVVVASSSTGGDSGGGTAYIPYVYAQGSALGGETTIAVPNGTVGVPFIIIEGYMNTVGYGFTFDTATLTVTLAQPLEEGDEVVLLLTGTPAVPDNPNISNWVTINWLYNGGYAVGGEQVIVIPYTFEAIPAIYKNGERYYVGLADKSYTVDAANQRILLTELLATNDRLIVQIGGESTTFIMTDRTVQEVARSANVHENEVILSTNTTQYLNDIKVVYDVVAQKIYLLPALPTNVYINSVSNGQLTYSPGNIVVDLIEFVTGNVALDAANTLRADLIANTGSDHVKTKLSAIAASVGRTVTSKLRDLVSIKDFGAVGDGVTDDTSAINAAINSGLALYAPKGTYICTAGLVANQGISLVGDGYGHTIFKFTNNTHGLWVKLKADASDPINIRDFSIHTMFAPDLTKPGLKIDGTAQVTTDTDAVGHKILNNRALTRGLIKNIELCGVDKTAHSWGTGLHMYSVMNFRVDGLYYSGRVADATDAGRVETAINFGGDGVPVDVSFSRLWIYYAMFGFNAPDYTEGVHISNFEMVHVDYGVYAGWYSSASTVASGITGALAYYVHDGHINSRNVGVDLYNSNQSKLYELVLYNSARAVDSASYPIRVMYGGYNNITGIHANLIGCLNDFTANRAMLLSKCVNSNVSDINVVGSAQSVVTLTDSSSYNTIDGITATSVNFLVDEIGGVNTGNTIGHNLAGTPLLKRIQLPINLATNFVNYKVIYGTGIATLASSQATVNITPVQPFDVKPRSISIAMGYTATGDVHGYYDYDASTTNNLVIKLRGNASGTTETVRYFVSYPLS